jgi:hypothetical protein
MANATVINPADGTEKSRPDSPRPYASCAHFARARHGLGQLLTACAGDHAIDIFLPAFSSNLLAVSARNLALT